MFHHPDIQAPPDYCGLPPQSDLNAPPQRNMPSVVKAFSDLLQSIVEVFASIIRTTFSAMQSIFALAGNLISGLFKAAGGIIEFILGKSDY